MTGASEPLRTARGSLRLVAAALTLVAAVGACADDPELPDDTFDGNVVIGDAEPVDLGPEDAGPEDSEPGVDVEPDSGPEDFGSDDDAGVLELGFEDAPDPCVATATVSLTPREALARATELDGAIVSITATASVSPSQCSGGPCSEGDPCCDTCTADLRLGGVLPLAASECFSPVGCRGTSCGVVCTPAALGLPARYIGRLTADGELELFRVP